MDIQSHKLPVTRTAHYYTLGQPSPQTERLWIVCHGYGQLAERFIRKFDLIAGEKDYIVAPEGLSRFYWGGLDGPVASSWMTRGDRLDEIADFAAMLSKIYNAQIKLLPREIEVVLFGFSQGCATQLRWMMQDFPRFDQLWLWGGFIPEDLDYRTEKVKAYLHDKPIYHFRGTEDELIKPEYIKLHRKLISQQELDVQEYEYSGDHRVVRTELSRHWINLGGA